MADSSRRAAPQTLPFADPTDRRPVSRAVDDLLLSIWEDAKKEARARRAAKGRRPPPVPDFRFEYSYTRSVAQYVHVDTAPTPTPISGKGKEKAVGGGEDEPGSEDRALVEHRGAGEVVRVEWGQVLWITARDQVLSPLLQGALWGVAGHFLRPLGAMLSAPIRAWWARGGRGGKGTPEVEGNGAQWLREWIGSILTPTAAASYTR